MKAIKHEREISEEEYMEFLNDIYGTVSVCGIEYDSGRLLKEIDPIAFRVGMNDYDGTREDINYYSCSMCGEEFEDEDDAENCCKESASYIVHGLILYASNQWTTLICLETNPNDYISIEFESKEKMIEFITELEDDSYIDMEIANDLRTSVLEEESEWTSII